jgi:hypothetical protein
MMGVLDFVSASFSFSGPGDHGLIAVPIRGKSDHSSFKHLIDFAPAATHIARAASAARAA